MASTNAQWQAILANPTQLPPIPDGFVCNSVIKAAPWLGVLASSRGKYMAIETARELLTFRCTTVAAKKEASAS